MADSPWPMPEVSTTIRSKPLILQQASTSGSAAEISVPVSRVASERMNILSDSIAFIRMRSPSNAPPVRLREGSIEMTAMRSRSPWSRRSRRMSSSGGSLQHRLAHAHRVGLIFHRRDHARELAAVAGTQLIQRLRFSRGQCGQIVVAGADDVVDHALQTQLRAVFGGVKARHAVGHEFTDLGRHDDAAAAAEHFDVVAPVLTEQVHHVFEKLDMAALVGGDGDALYVFLQGRIDDFLHRAVVA